MQKSKPNKFAIICAILFLLKGISGLSLYFSPSDTDAGFLSLLYPLLNVVFAVSLLIRKKYPVLIITSGTLALYDIISLVADFSISSVLIFLADASVAALILINTAPFLSEKANLTKKLWFVPCTLALLNQIISIIIASTKGNFSYQVGLFILIFISICPYIFIGLWLKDICEPKETETESEIMKYASFDSQNVVLNRDNSDEIGGAEKIELYKELLDSGAITQEEFDEKKKQILG